MIAAESYPPLDCGARWHHTNGLLEVHQTKISFHRASAEYTYPTVRLPHYLAGKLAGLSTRIYQTIHDGALAFLVVVSPDTKAVRQSVWKSENAKISFDRILDMAEVAVRIQPSPLVFDFMRAKAFF